MPRKPTSHCPNGHPRTPENTYTVPSTGKRKCQVCNLARRREYTTSEKDRVYGARWRAKNPDYARRKYLRDNYNITPADFERMLADQEGRCLICLVTLTDERTIGASPTKACVDHDHSCCAGSKSCGRCIRGLLCNLCNVGIGSMRDRPDLLIRAARYLEHSRIEESAA